MSKKSLLLLACTLALGVNYAQDKKTAPLPNSTAPAADTSKSKKLSIADKVKSSKKIEGLFTVYQDTITGSVQLFVKKNQLGREYIYQSFAVNGPTYLFLNQGMHRANFVFKAQKSFDKLELARVNTSLWYDPSNAVSKTKEIDKPEAVFVSEKIVAEDADGYLVSADGIFLSEKMDGVKPVFPPGVPSFMMFNLGNLNPAKSKYNSIKSFPGNTDFLVDLAYDNPQALNPGGNDITDPRYVRLRLQHTFMEIPENNFKPRMDDPRIGFFTRQVTDQTSVSPVPYKDMIFRWNLVKKDPNAALSEPVEPIVFWIENTTPVEYRQTIVDAGHAWNKSFEKAGFKNAVQMKIMPDNADWDPSDIRYNVIRWVSSVSPNYGAIGPCFTNPKTGQVLGSDITIEWYSGSFTPVFAELYTANASTPQLQVPGMDNNHAGCSLASELKSQFITGTTFLDATGADKSTAEEMHKQFLTYLILHEMGHTLGLNHNMKASQLWSPAEINNKAVTSKVGLIGSVMDYPAINIAADRNKQGEYYTTVPGPYDDWAIEYGYTPLKDSEEAAALKKIVSRSTEPQLAFGNDGDDMRLPGKAMDPRVNVNDLTNDAVGYAEERFKIVNSIMGKLVQKYSKPDQSYAELRARFNMLQGQRMGMIAAVSRYVGGVYVDRSFPGQNSSTKPFTPVPLALQKRAMNTLAKYVFAPDAFTADAPVYAYLQAQRRGFNQPGNGEDYKITGSVLQQQVFGGLMHILHPATLQRITNSRLYGNQYSVADVLVDLNAAIFNADLKTNVNVFRQSLQMQYVKGLLSIVEDKNSQYDDIAKAGALNALRKIKTLMATGISTNEETKAHRAALIYTINSELDKK